jgi:hypothetical protein
MTINRQVKEGTLKQGVDEQVYYKLTTTDWGSTPTSVVVTLFERASGVWTERTSTMLSGSASVTGDVITSPKVAGLTEGLVYRLEFKFTVSGNIFEPYALIECER